MSRYLLSSLIQRHRRASLASFQAELPGPFLVWEPGPWLPRGMGATFTAAQGGLRPATGETREALALALAFPPGKDRLVLGRDVRSELVVNDGTLSRSHLALGLARGGLLVEDLGSRNGSWLDGVPLQPGQPRPLQSGAQLQAGSVYFTFLDAAGLLERLRRGAG